CHVPVPGTGTWHIATTGRAASVQPGGEEALDVAAATRSLEPAGHGRSLDDHERRHLRDLEAFEQIRSFLLCDAHHLERPVISASLQHLGQEAIHPAALPR